MWKYLASISRAFFPNFTAYFVGKKRVRKALKMGKRDCEMFWKWERLSDFIIKVSICQLKMLLSKIKISAKVLILFKNIYVYIRYMYGLYLYLYSIWYFFSLKVPHCQLCFISFFFNNYATFSWVSHTPFFLGYKTFNMAQQNGVAFHLASDFFRLLLYVLPLRMGICVQLCASLSVFSLLFFV